MPTQKAPFVVKVPPGDYWWCACGESSNQPYCDGSHKKGNTGKHPMKVSISEEKNVAWCGCKATAKPPFCDGTHSKL